MNEVHWLLDSCLYRFSEVLGLSSTQTRHRRGSKSRHKGSSQSKISRERRQDEHPKHRGAAHTKIRNASPARHAGDAPRVREECPSTHDPGRRHPTPSTSNSTAAVTPAASTTATTATLAAPATTTTNTCETLRRDRASAAGKKINNSARAEVHHRVPHGHRTRDTEYLPGRPIPPRSASTRDGRGRPDPDRREGSLSQGGDHHHGRGSLGRQHRSSLELIATTTMRRSPRRGDGHYDISTTAAPPRRGRSTTRRRQSWYLDVTGIHIQGGGSSSPGLYMQGRGSGSSGLPPRHRDLSASLGPPRKTRKRDDDDDFSSSASMSPPGPRHVPEHRYRQPLRSALKKTGSYHHDSQGGGGEGSADMLRRTNTLPPTGVVRDGRRHGDHQAPSSSERSSSLGNTTSNVCARRPQQQQQPSPPPGNLSRVEPYIRERYIPALWAGRRYSTA